MKYRFTILNVAAFLFLLWVIFYGIYNDKQLLEGEGWGMVAMISLFVIGVVLVVVDVVIQAIFKDRFVVNVLGAIAVIVAAYLLMYK